MGSLDGAVQGEGLLIWLAGQRTFRWLRSLGPAVIRLASEGSNGALNRVALCGQNAVPEKASGSTSECSQDIFALGVHTAISGDSLTDREKAGERAGEGMF